MSKIFILNETEYIVLLMLHGVNQIFGLELNPLGSEPEREVSEAMFSLRKKQLIKENNGLIELEDKLKHIIELVISADEVISVFREKDNPFNLCIYRGEASLVVSEKLGETGKIIRLQEYVSLEECFEDREVFLYQVLDDAELYMESAIEKEELPEILEQVVDITINKLEADCKENVQLYMGGARDYILAEGKYYAYSKKKLLELLEREEISDRIG